MDRRSFLRAGIAGLGLSAAIPVRRLHAGTPRTAAPGARPNPQQLAWQRRETALFVHFGVNTFTNREWGDGTEDPRIFNPARLDARQWTRAARAGGFQTVILTAKHHDGFCLWPSALTDHSVRSSPWRGGKGDVVREFVDACRAEGLGAGLYLSPWDRHEPRYGDSPLYNDYYVAQLTELLTGYGPLVEVWFDGANGEGPNGRKQVYDWPRIHATVRRLQPDALMFSDAGPDIRWIGNERGIAADPNWCAVDPATVPQPGVSGPAVTASLQHGDPHGSVWRPGEADVSIRPGWFWHPAEDERVRTADNLIDLYFSSVGRNANLLLNVPPTTDGLFHETDVARLAEFGRRRAALFAHDLAAGARAAWSRGADGHTGTLELDLGRPVTFDVVRLEEAIENGQTIERYRLLASSGGEWREISAGTTIGHAKLDRVQPITATRLRLEVSSIDEPRIDAVRVYNGTTAA